MRCFFIFLFAYVDLWFIHLSSPEQESYSESETDRSARTGDSEIFKDLEIKRFRFSIFQGSGHLGGAPGQSPVSKSQNVPSCMVWKGDHISENPKYGAASLYLSLIHI